MSRPSRRLEDIAETISELVEWLRLFKPQETISDLVEWLTKVRRFFKPDLDFGSDWPDWLKLDQNLGHLDPDFLRDYLRSGNYEKLDDLCRLETMIWRSGQSWLRPGGLLLAQVTNDLRSYAGWREDEGG